MDTKPQTSVLFVCLGNICRSPLAEGVFRHVVAGAGLEQKFVIDSAGTGAWHEGAQPDPRSMAVAAKNGIDLSGQRARKIRPDDFSRFTHIFGMDRSNVTDLETMAPAGAIGAVHLFLDFATGSTADIPDPYYGGADGFDAVYRTIWAASQSLVRKLA